MVPVCLCVTTISTTNHHIIIINYLYICKVLFSVLTMKKPKTKMNSTTT